MILGKPPLYAYRNGHGAWSPPFGKISERDYTAPLRIDIKFPMLGFLMDAELTGYDLKRLFQESVGFFYRVSDGSLYPALKKLARDKLVTMRTERNGKRARKLYAITPAGRGHFLKMLAEPSPPVFVHDEAQVKIYFGHHNPGAAMAHMQRMREFDEMWSQQLATMVTDMKTRGESPFHKLLVKIGHQLTAFKAQMMAKLEVEVTRELALLAGGHDSPARRPVRSAGARR